MSAFERLLEQKAVALQYSPEKDTASVFITCPIKDQLDHAASYTAIIMGTGNIS